MVTQYDIDKCKEALILKRLDQKDLAEEGLSESAISKFFRGAPVRMKTAARIIEKLSLKWKDVVTITPEPRPVEIPEPRTADATRELVGATKRRRA